MAHIGSHGWPGLTVDIPLLAVLKRFCSRDKDLLMKAFCTYVRPLLEYSTPVWSSHYQYLIFKIENVQRAYTKRLTGMNNLIIWSVLRFWGFRLLSDGGWSVT